MKPSSPIITICTWAMRWLPDLKGVWCLGYSWLHNTGSFCLDKVSIAQVQTHDLSSLTSLATQVNQQDLYAGSCLSSYCDDHLYPQTWPLLRPAPTPPPLPCPPTMKQKAGTGGVRESLTSTSTYLVHFAFLSAPLPPRTQLHPS